MVDGKMAWRKSMLLGPVLVCGLALTGCSSMNPVNWYRDLTGSSQDDPGSDARNTGNLDAGSQQPYPNLSSVPQPPVRGLTAEQRAALANGLIADRTNARYAAAKVRQDDASAIMAAQIPIPEEQIAETPQPAPERAPRAEPVEPVSIGPLLGPPIVPQRPHKPATAAPATPASADDLSAGGVLGGDTPAPNPTAAQQPPQPASDDGLSAGGALGNDTAANQNAAAPPETAQNPAGQQHVAPPKESSLQTPVPRETPEPEATIPPPAAPTLPPLPPPAAPKAIAGMPAPAPSSSGATATPAVPEQAAAVPPAPTLAPNPAAPPAPAEAAKPAPMHLGSVAFAPGSTGLPGGADATVQSAVAQYKQHPGSKFRIVGYAPAGSGDSTTAALASAQAALANATAVKQALIAAGVPAGDIVTEAAPKAATSGRADILLGN
jgi:outer membrane protein OmpA-like peptidoglycan-associated protein